MQEGLSSSFTHSLEEKVDILMAQISQLVCLLTLQESDQLSAEVEAAEDEGEVFSLQYEEETIKSPVDGKVCLSHCKYLMEL